MFQYFHSHRFGLAKSCLEIGLKVFIIYGEEGNIDKRKLLINKNLKLIHCPFQRGGLNLFNEINSILKIFLLFKNLKPDIVHLINIKPYLYGGFAAKILNIPSISSITGLVLQLIAILFFILFIDFLLSFH